MQCLDIAFFLTNCNQLPFAFKQPAVRLPACPRQRLNISMQRCEEKKERLKSSEAEEGRKIGRRREVRGMAVRRHREGMEGPFFPWHGCWGRAGTAVEQACSSVGCTIPVCVCVAAAARAARAW